jgi:chromosome segregation ATPase
LQESQSRLAECETALKEANARADEFAALLKSSELARAASLAEFEAQKVCVTALADERDALSATTAELQSGIETLRTAIAEVGRSRQEGEVIASQLRTEIASLRRQGEAAGETLQAEITSLKNELAAAREVGKAAIDALRYEAVRPAPALSKPGWWASVPPRFRLRVGDPFPTPG